MATSFNEIRLADGTVLQASEWLHWPVYTTVDIGNADRVDLAGFSYVVGNVVPHTTNVTERQATRCDTNLVRRNKMNQDEALVVVSIAHENFAIDDDTKTGSPTVMIAPAPMLGAIGLRNLQRQLLIELLVGAGIKKPQYGVPYSYIPSSLGTKTYGTGDAQEIWTGTAGDVTTRNLRQLGLPIYIGGFGENAKPGNSMFFRLRVRTPGGALTGVDQDIRQRWWLNGLKKRPA